MVPCGQGALLLVEPGKGGLQVERDGEWVDAPSVPGAFVVNIGDLMARWTAGAWVSTLHRVVALPGQPARQSLAFFHQPDWEAEIRPLDGSEAAPPVRSGPYLRAKFAAADLIGIPWQILVGPKGLAEGKLEIKRRSDGSREKLSPADVVARLAS